MLLGARHVPERLCGGLVYLGRYNKCSPLPFYLKHICHFGDDSFQAIKNKTVYGQRTNWLRKNMQKHTQNTALNSSDNLPSYPPGSHHSSHDVYWREWECGIWWRGQFNCHHHPLWNFSDLKKFKTNLTLVKRNSILQKKNFLIQHPYISIAITCYLSEVKFIADTMTSSTVWTRTGILRHPGDLRILCSICSVSCRMFGGHMSIFVTTTKTGTPSARASPRCSFVMPTTPAFAPICEQVFRQPGTHPKNNPFFR